MLNFIKGLVVGGALLAPMTGHALVKFPHNPLSHPTLLLYVDYNDLAAKDQKRLDFYADRIVSDLMALVVAGDSGDAEAARKLVHDIADLSSRLIDTGIQFGLTDLEIENVFSQRFELGYSGQPPEFMIVDTGIAGVHNLLSIELDAATSGIDSSGGDDYVDSVRSAGETLFND